jgi:AGCS family alanine or glycine:cation symporter
MEQLERILDKIDGVIWGWPLLVLLLGTHLFLTFRLGIIQRHIFKGIRLSFTRTSEGEGDVSHFGALMTALAATIGTGNIVGVATAVAAGGPGAVLWMWFTGVFGIATKYGEALLSVKYRITTPSGQMAGGPMYVLERGLKMRWLGMVFAAFTAIAAFGIGNMVQSNAIAGMTQNLVCNYVGGSVLLPGYAQDLIPWVVGVILTILTALVILGGIKSIARVCEKFVPVMAVVYILGCLVILAMRFDQLWDTICLICTSAFTGQAAVGGFLGAGIKEAMRYGTARGLFSNESGLGSAPIVAAAAQTRTPVRQALVSSTGTFWDTVVICALTGLVVVSSGEWTKGLKDVALSRAAFNDIPFIGPIILWVGLITFVYSTILGWSYYGEKAMEYLFGPKSLKPYRWLWVCAVMVGAVVKIPVVWSFADITNALMALPNLIALLLLSGVIARETKLHWDDIRGIHTDRE